MLSIFLVSGSFIFLFTVFKFWEEGKKKITRISRFFSSKDYFLRRVIQGFLVSWRSVKRSFRLFFLVEIPFMIRKMLDKTGFVMKKKFDQIKDDIRGKYLASHRGRTTSKYLKEISNEVIDLLSPKETSSPELGKSVSVDKNKSGALGNAQELGGKAGQVTEDSVPGMSTILKSTGPGESEISVKELIAIKKISSASALKIHKGARAKRILLNSTINNSDKTTSEASQKIKNKRRKKMRQNLPVESSVLVRTHPEGDVMSGELVIIENLRRGYLDPVARAKAFLKLTNVFNLKHTQIAEKVGKSREHFSNTLRILSLPEAMLEALKKGKITEGHTRPLLMLHGRATAQESLFKEIVSGDLTVREAETISRKVASDRVRKKS